MLLEQAAFAVQILEPNPARLLSSRRAHFWSALSFSTTWPNAGLG